MAENTKIEWAHHTFNPWIGCTKVSPACDHCYAEADFATRRKVVQWGAGQPRKHTAPSTWAQPLRWNAEAERLGVRYRVFCASLADVFDNEVPKEWRVELWELIQATPQLDWLLLTKRVGNVFGMLPDGWAFQTAPWPNVWIGASITSQVEADRDIPKLLAVPAAKRFLSMEPLLGPVDLTNIRQPLAGESFTEGNVLVHKSTMDRGAQRASIDWVIVGGESGPNARPMHPDWARSLRDQCQAAGVPFLFKQWGEWGQWRHELVHEGPECAPTRAGYMPTRHYFRDAEGNTRGLPVLKVGKKAAGRLLDGRTWDEVPS